MFNESLTVRFDIFISDFSKYCSIIKSEFPKKLVTTALVVISERILNRYIPFTTFKPACYIEFFWHNKLSEICDIKSLRNVLE